MFVVTAAPKISSSIVYPQRTPMRRWCERRARIVKPIHLIVVLTALAICSLWTSPTENSAGAMYGIGASIVRTGRPAIMWS